MDVYMEDRHVGRLIINDKSSLFIYSKAWIAHGFPIAPSMPLDVREHYAVGVHGIFTDTAPDSWGRRLIHRFQGGYVSERDYILGVSDQLRLGALRFSLDGGITYEGKEKDVPPVSSLARLKHLIDAMMRGEDHDYSELVANVSLGGARAKLVVSDGDKMYLAKIPQITDNDDVHALEYLCLELAAAVGINTAKSRLYGSGNSHSLLLERFDRHKDSRIHYMSAMTLMGLKDGESSTYVDLALEVADMVGSHCLQELYKRMLLNILVGNTDDHLRNHGFLYIGGRWHLSPAFDITMSKRPYGANHTLRINGCEPDTFDTALMVSDYFGLDTEEARRIMVQITERAEGMLQGNTISKTTIKKIADYVFIDNIKKTIAM